MDAIRIARAKTKRETIMKIFGSYHGHHDGVMVSIGVEYDAIGDKDDLASLPYGAGIPQAVVDLTIAVPFNDAEAMDRRIARLDAEGRKPACVIMEAAMMNLGIVLPEPGYLEAVREITERHGIVLIFDEVKTGLCVGPGGATARWGVMPDMVTLAKSLGGLSEPRDGGSDESSGRRERQRLQAALQRPTRSGWPRAREPARGADAGCLGHLDSSPIGSRAPGVLEKTTCPLTARHAGTGWSRLDPTVTTTRPSRPTRTMSLRLMAGQMNRGIFMTPGREEEWRARLTHTDYRSTLRAVHEMSAGDACWGREAGGRSSSSTSSSFSRSPGPGPQAIPVVGPVCCVAARSGGDRWRGRLTRG